MSNVNPNTGFRKGSKRDAAAKIFAKHGDKGRAVCIQKFQDQLDMSPQTASTYFQTLRVETGVAHQKRRSSRLKPKAKAAKTA